jgi:2-polyprenyl-6-methoxyphenol hydroxylase-like FAD-dependent oxidoreductase
MNSKQTTQSNKHAVVIGASMAGLMAARVLSDHFEQVTIIERDHLPEQVDVRKGVPQGQHVHALLAKGAAILTELFPGLFEALTQHGAVRFTPQDIRSYTTGSWNTRFPSSIHIYSQSRPFLEQYVRDFLAARGNVRVLDACEVTRLLATADSSRVTGVSLSSRSGERCSEELAADLVVDASGRGSRAPQWLVSLGYTRVEESSVTADVGYATRIFRRPSHLPLDWKMLMITSTPPEQRQAGMMTFIEGDRWIVTLASSWRDCLPGDEDSFLEYARSLPQPDLYEAIKEAEPLTPVLNYKYSANRWRHYERMSRLPAGFMILGDAVCSFNPVYGQGMTVAALEAKVLDAFLRQHPRGISNQERGLAQRFQKAIAKVVEWPWQMATGADRPYLETQEEPGRLMRLLNWYMQRVMQLTTSNALVVERFGQVLHLLKPPTVLLDPRIAWAVLRQELASHLQKPMASLHSGQLGSRVLTHRLDAVAK